MNKKINTGLIIVFVCSLLFSACPQLLIHDSNDDWLSPGMGYLTIKIAGEKVGRTIMPSTPGLADLRYELIFDGTPLDEPPYRTYAELGDPIELLPGTYSLVINAYREEGEDFILVAKGSDPSVVITADGGTESEIELRANITDDSDAEGIFSWNFIILDDLDTSEINITITIDPLETANYIAKNVPITIVSGTLGGNLTGSDDEISVGYYNVSVKFESTDVNVKDIIIYEVLYVYQGLESILTINLSKDFFNSNWYEVTFNYDHDNNLNTKGSVEHGKANELSLPTPATRPGFIFDAWYTDNDVKWSSLSSDQQKMIGIRDFTLNAKWFKDLGAAIINITDPTFTGTEYTAQALQALVYTVTYGEDVLVRGTHYNLSITNGSNARKDTDDEPPTITIEAIPGSGYAGTNSKTFTIFRKPVNNIDIIGIVIPGNGMDPSSNAEYDDEEYQGVFSIDSVVWKTDGETFDGKFQGNTVYSVEITLSLTPLIGDNYTFIGFNDAEIDGREAEVLPGTTMTSAVISYTFGATSNKIVTDMLITAQPLVMEYIHGDILNLASDGLKVTLFYENTEFDEFEPEEFEPVDFYVNGITTIPVHGHVLSYSGTYNNHPVKVIGYNIERETTVNLVISKATPSYDTPTNLTATYGQTLENVTLPEDFTWEDALDTPVGPVAGPNNFTVKYTPKDTNFREITGIPVTISVSKATPTPATPSGLTAIYGQTLADVTSQLPTGFTWEQATTTPVGPVAGPNSFFVKYSLDPANYNDVTGIEVSIAVSKATPTPDTPAGLTAIYGQTLADVTSQLPTGFTWEQATTTPVGPAGPNDFTVKFTPADPANYNEVTGIAVSIAVSTRPITIVPDSLYKIFDGQDPAVLTFTAWYDGTEEEIIEGNTQTGSLIRAPGENVGNYLIGFGNPALSWGPNYSLSLSTTPVYFEIKAAASATVNNLTLTSTYNSITITAATLTGNLEQIDIEYAYNKTGVTPDSWTDLDTTPKTISSLESGTRYYIFARAKESTNFAAGEVRREEKWTLTELKNITITFNPLATNPAKALSWLPNHENITLTIEADSPAYTIIMPEAGFTSIRWYLNDSEVPIYGVNTWEHILNGSGFDRFAPKEQYLYVEVVKDSIIYSLTIPFRVEGQ